MYLGQTPYIRNEASVNGSFIERNGARYYRIAHVDQMPPFFISLVSHAEHWMFIASNGGLTAGREKEDHAVFPYYTDDKIIQSAAYTGPLSVFRVEKAGKTYLWTPFSDRYKGVYPIERHLCKSVWGNELIFEEYNPVLGLRFTYSWRFSASYGFVRSCELRNESSEKLSVELLDGLQNILPYGIDANLQNIRSNLANAYKRSELHSASKLAVYALSAIIVDRAVPAEALKASIAWSSGLSDAQVLLSSDQLETFTSGGSVVGEADKKGVAGAYLLHTTRHLDAGDQANWQICVDGHKTQPQIVDLIDALMHKPEDLMASLAQELAEDRQALKRIVAKADGLQCTADELSITRHYSNVLFNVMRGGLFEEDYRIETADWAAFIQSMNALLFETNKAFFTELPEQINYSELLHLPELEANADLKRLAYEYLPLTFSRRHGDPSRPWNRFNIELKNPDGSRHRAYAGNWRDIFQNWEALALAYPAFITGMIAKFLNASTIDGYNPYRISREGVDWEIIEPEDPWSYIGYWGDHQLIYLLKLLEIARSHRAMRLADWANNAFFVYANVPYRLKSFDEIVANPQDTISFDEALHHEIELRVKAHGNDQKLCTNQQGNLLKSSFVEKLLVTWLTKLYNFIPEAGIWMNTQRPEWNDANNALVGNGVSMVTLSYMRRFSAFFADWLQQEGPETIHLHEEVRDLLRDCAEVLQRFESQLTAGWNDAQRRDFATALGRHGERYRTRAYHGFGHRHVDYSTNDLLDCIHRCVAYIDQTIRHNQEANGLFHAYNLIHLEEEGWRVSHLYEMLEGQVAALSSGLLDDRESLAVLDSLKQSALFRPDQYSYLLYPNRNIPGFFERNHIPEDRLEANRLFRNMRERGDRRLIEFDAKGKGYFNGSITNAGDVQLVLDAVIYEYPECGERHQKDVLDIFEKMFNHKAFTGRSGTFFAYEGLGSIYWHMVSKLLLSVQETLRRFPNSAVKGQLVDHYYEIRAGIGINKSPDLYGAFPTDPYSHTPIHRGAQQPGMTGQVKEDILNRWAELGIEVRGGQLVFSPAFLNEGEWLPQSTVFEYVDLAGQFKTIALQPHQLAFTYCQVPVVYQKAAKAALQIMWKDGRVEQQEGHVLDVACSSHILNRSGEILQLQLDIPS